MKNKGIVRIGFDYGNGNSEMIYTVIKNRKICFSSEKKYKARLFIIRHSIKRLVNIIIIISNTFTRF